MSRAGKDHDYDDDWGFDDCYVSRRTVESHLGRVYTKLDLSTRTHLVAAVGRRGGHRG